MPVRTPFPHFAGPDRCDSRLSPLVASSVPGCAVHSRRKDGSALHSVRRFACDSDFRRLRGKVLPALDYPGCKPGHYPLPIPVAAATGFRQLCRILPDRKSRIPEGIRALFRLAGSIRSAALAVNRFVLFRPCRTFPPQGCSCAALCQAVCIAAGFRRPRCILARLPVSTAARTIDSGNRTGFGSR
jgi:hypothetical protein